MAKALEASMDAAFEEKDAREKGILFEDFHQLSFSFFCRTLCLPFKPTLSFYRGPVLMSLVGHL